MKKILPVMLAGAFLAACNDNTADTTTTVSTDTNATTNTTTTMDTGSAAITSSTATTTTTTTAYAPVEGDVTYTNKKVQVRKGDQWVDADADVRLDNGVVVTRSGRVRRDDVEIDLQEGEVVNKTGRFFDKAGNAIENAWDDTKRGVKKAGKAVGNAAEKVGEKVKDAVDKDNVKNQ